MPKVHVWKAERLDRPEDQLAAYEELRISKDFCLTVERKQ